MPIALKTLHLRLSFQCHEAVRFNPFSASAWRGCLGHHLKKTVCMVRGQSSCQTCMLAQNCVYTQVFESMPDPHAQKMRLYQDIPVPYVLKPQHEQRLKQGDDCSLHMLLFGSACSYLPFILDALGREPLEIGHGKLQLQHVDVESPTGSGQWQTCYQQGKLLAHQATCARLPAAPKQLRIELTSTLRLRQNNRFVRPEALTFRDFLSFLLRRTSLLHHFYGDSGLEVDHRSLLFKADQVLMTQKELRWKDDERYSSRQKTTMKTGGLLGSFHIELDPEFWPYLWHGQWLHVGKNTSMGQGGYALKEVSEIQ
ncbi:MAG: CRISPR system precrRNA processing endoribonuclease RAMP protein Cas6 [Mariprofundaceae bacterium]|nr:CRISPR system precrRNA processing endoribonuclease RAMP protein Cas6 [Mariprofundaceae bacterium]